MTSFVNYLAIASIICAAGWWGLAIYLPAVYPESELRPDGIRVGRVLTFFAVVGTCWLCAG